MVSCARCDVAEQEIGEGVAGERAVEREVAARRRDVEVLVVHRQHHVGAELHLVAAAQPGQRVEVLELLGVLELRHEVRRPEPDVAGDVDADDAADHARVVGDAVEPDLRVAVLTERILGAVVGAARVREARFVDQRAADHLGPADDHARPSPGSCGPRPTSRCRRGRRRTSPGT